ncbi:putative sulfate exporter family transporter [Sutcliffiella horikoshii]|uniref:Putative sulfate exporter family transporter n=1 Tax=Sutcliffiella horikoshii TaxID=79883 RepID=A0A5D4T5Y3_9BACI|nr:putative sulfate exporter family transporter [Sutcliffiella horikoshii]TYS71003.1 putative sulfate exporter family transporter [Sutcliffiella horikoshii]
MNKTSINKMIPGILLILVISLMAKLLGGFFPSIGGVLFALLIGIIIRNSVELNEKYNIGISTVVKKWLKVAIVLLGATLSFNSILDIGAQSILVIILVVSGGIAVTLLVGKLMKIDKMLALLIGVGTSICGATAISVFKGVVQAKEAIVAYAISTIFFFNILATFLYPVLGQWLQLSIIQMGIWAGTSIHDTSSVVAVGYLLGDEVGEVATTVKLVRTLFILPLVLAISFIMVRRNDNTQSLKGAFPVFILGFLFMSGLYSTGLITEAVSRYVGSIAKFLIIMVMAGVGLQVRWKNIRSLGLKPFVVGFIASVFVGVTSLLFVLYLL